MPRLVRLLTHDFAVGGHNPKPHLAMVVRQRQPVMQVAQMALEDAYSPHQLRLFVVNATYM